MEYFFRKKDYINFSSFSDLIEKINYYLSNDKKREEVASNGNYTCLKLHTSKNRAIDIVEVLNKLLNNN